MSYYIPLGEPNDKQSEVVPPRSNFERPPPWYGRIKQAVETTPSMFQASKVISRHLGNGRRFMIYGFQTNQVRELVKKEIEQIFVLFVISNFSCK